MSEYRDGNLTGESNESIEVKCNFMCDNMVCTDPLHTVKMTRKEFANIKSSGKKLKCPNCGGYTLVPE